MIIPFEQLSLLNLTNVCNILTLHDEQNTLYMYVVCENKMYLHLLQDK